MNAALLTCATRDGAGIPHARALRLASALVLACTQAEPALTPEQERHVIATGEAVASALKGRLVGRLTTVLQTGGAVAAIEVCATEATALTLAIADSAGGAIAVKRTSTRTRNPVNAPDSLERVALAWFEAEIAAGKPLPTRFLQRESARSHRYYAPLAIAPFCVQCHGPPGGMDPEVLGVIARRYPQDGAIGYADGDFRGLIRVTVPVASRPDREAPKAAPQ